MPPRNGHTPQRHILPRRHREVHHGGRAGWLRAAVLGANDGILSTGALLLGVASADATRAAVLTAGVAGMVAGAASMAIGEYVSVSSQKDTERADREVEALELERDPVGEHAELTGIYVGRGLTPELAGEVASQLMRNDALGAHLRDELGQHETTLARPFQAAWSSFVSFALGAALPLLVAAVAGIGARVPAIAAATLIGLLGLGALAAWLAGASVPRGALRVGVGGLLALALTFGVGRLLGTTVA